jgi:streptogramin lyase
VDATCNGSFVESYGTEGATVGQLNTPTGIDVAADGTIWVADTRNSRIQKRSPSGVWTAFTAPVGASTFSVPWGVTVAPDGAIWVADSGRNRLVKADTAMKPAFVLDGAALGAGKLAYPYEIEFGAAGEVYVSDTFNNRVIELKQ